MENTDNSRVSENRCPWKPSAGGNGKTIGIKKIQLENSLKNDCIYVVCHNSRSNTEQNRMGVLHSIWRSHWRYRTIHSDVGHAVTRQSFDTFVKRRFFDGGTSVNAHYDIVETLIEGIVDGKLWRFLRHVFRSRAVVGSGRLARASGCGQCCQFYHYSSLITRLNRLTIKPHRQYLFIVSFLRINLCIILHLYDLPITQLLVNRPY